MKSRFFKAISSKGNKAKAIRHKAQSCLSSMVCGLKPVYGLKWRMLLLTFIIHHSSFIISKAQLNLSSCACPADLPAGGGSFSGKTCFDIALSNDNTNSCGPLATRISTKEDFTQTATNTQVYTYTPAGTVSKVRFSFEDLGGLAIQSITPASTAYKTALNLNTPCNVTVVYKNNLNTTALGLTAATAIKPKLSVVYNDNGNGLGSDVKLELTAQIKDCVCNCPAPTNTGGILEFMCYNLGAENSGLDPMVYNGGAINGDLYQWGRLKDGHQIITSSTTTTGSTTDVPGHGSFIISYDWRNPTNDALWGDTKTPSDPCPAGYRIPKKTEWESIYSGVSANWVWTGNGYKVGNKLYLPAAGNRGRYDGIVDTVGSNGYYWSSNVNGGLAFNLSFYTGFVNITYSNPRAFGYSIRCVVE